MVYRSIDDSGHRQDNTLGDILRGSWRAKQVQSIAQCLNKNRTDQRTPNVATTSKQTRPAHNCRSDRHEKKIGRIRLYANAQNPRGTQDSSSSRKQAVHGKGGKHGLPG